MQQSTPHHPITSKDNTTIKLLRSLSEPKYRKKEKAFLIEGIKTVEEAVRENLGVTMIAAAPSLTQHHGKGILGLAESKAVPVLWISERLLESISQSKTPQPVIAVARIREHSEEDLLHNESGLVVVAHQLQDPGNLGTIIRTAEAVGASGVAVTASTVDPFNAKAIRASMGSILRLPVVHVKDLNVFIRKCRDSGFQTVATAVTGEKTLYDVDFIKPTIVFFGQEGDGLPHDIMSGIDTVVRIPMAEKIDSLNVATAAGVVLYEALRQRQHASKKHPAIQGG